MSGNAVQRGELALADKYYRAEMALASGADLVLELPFPWCASGAESFALCGVRIAGEFSDVLCFGSECGDIAELSRAAEIASGEEFVFEYKNRLSGNAGSAEAYFDLLSSKTGRSYSSNDILGIEYLKAAKKLGSSLSFFTVKREGAAYGSENLEAEGFQSATAIRKAVSERGADAVSKYMPDGAASVLRRAEDKRGLADIARIEKAVKLYFRMKKAEELDDIAEADGGLASRICRVARECGEESFFESLKTKRYTDSRIRRAVLFSLVGVTRADISGTPAYVNMLGANERGRRLLAERRNKTSVAVLSKAADVPADERAGRQAELSERLDSLYSLALERESTAGELIRKSPVIF